jgi:nucleotide-binding universal stress UspA family protein
MIKKICIAIDYSPTSQKVVETGYEYAKALGAQVLLVHVVSDAVYYMGGHDSMMGYEGFNAVTNMHVVEDLKETSRNYLKSVAAHLGNEGIETKVLEGNVSDVMLDQAKVWGADLLVLGTHGRSFLENMLIGNTAVNIVKHAEIPLLIVPVKQDKKEYK